MRALTLNELSINTGKNNELKCIETNLHFLECVFLYGFLYLMQCAIVVPECPCFHIIACVRVSLYIEISAHCRNVSNNTSCLCFSTCSQLIAFCSSMIAARRRHLTRDTTCRTQSTLRIFHTTSSSWIRVFLFSANITGKN